MNFNGKPFYFKKGPEAWGSQASGMTLPEVIVTLAIISLILLLGIPALNTVNKSNLKSATRTLAGALRYAFDSAIVSGKLYRLVLEIDKQRYWLEYSKKEKLIERETEKEEKKEAKKEEVKEVQFTKDTSKLGKETPLPRGVVFSDIEKAGFESSFSSGKIFVHVFPHGYMEKVAIHLKDAGDNEMTLVNNPITGRSRIYERRYSILKKE